MMKVGDSLWYRPSKEETYGLNGMRKEFGPLHAVVLAVHDPEHAALQITDCDGKQFFRRCIFVKPPLAVVAEGQSFAEFPHETPGQ